VCVAVAVAVAVVAIVVALWLVLVQLFGIGRRALPAPIVPRLVGRAKGVIQTRPTKATCKRRLTTSITQ
jgi:hypothetical protein